MVEEYVQLLEHLLMICKIQTHLNWIQAIKTVLIQMVMETHLMVFQD